MVRFLGARQFCKTPRVSKDPRGLTPIGRLQNCRTPRFFLLCMFSCSIQWAIAQLPDSTRTLNEIVIKGFAYNRPLKEVPASIAIVGKNELERFNNTSLLPAINTVPGVRMEERSPGSFRLSIRGSSLRSPFGIRNVKFYWNGLPMTDGGGNTYLNLMDFDAVGRIEIIKGPGGGLYGAGSGGVVLLNSALSKTNQWQAMASGGSFGLQKYQASMVTGKENKRLFINYAHHQADGYRQQSAMRRDALNVEGQFLLSKKNKLQASLFFTDLFYQTPGALTQAQYNADPSQAQLAQGSNKSAVDQQASINNKTIYGGVNDDHQWNESWSTRAGLYFSYTDFTNPSIRNYERRSEYNYGGRTDTQYEFKKSSVNGKITLGAEFQDFYSPLTDYGNKLGVKDTLQSDDQLRTKFAMSFAQVEVEIPHSIFITVGASYSGLRYYFKRVGGSPLPEQNRKFDAVISPRIAALKKISEGFSLFGSVSKGYSPPSLAEVRPSTGIYNNELSPEQGINYELGFRGLLLKKISFDVTGYDFELAQTIVSQKQANNADYFINSGDTRQLGLEMMVGWQHGFKASIVNSLNLWTSASFNNYHFLNYNRDKISYSGNQLTGSPVSSIAGGIDASFLKKFYCHFTANFVDRIPLNDANTFYSSDYLLLGSRLGFKQPLSGKTTIEIFVGIDNALDQRYSLGNDLNANGNRYFNAAMPGNYFFGVKMGLGH
jgi:iron complex outermembrane recepter protein